MFETCIFCKGRSITSKSIEHIIPQSLGNKLAVLPVGVVCDKCNNYFAGSVERELLAQDYFQNLRSRNGIPTKKRRTPATKGYTHLKERSLDVHFRDRSIEVIVPTQNQYQKLLRGDLKEIIIKYETEPHSNNLLLSRFLAKVALEIVALKFIEGSGTYDYILEEPAFNNLRNYARYGRGVRFWEYYQRVIRHEMFLKDGKQNVYEFNTWSTEESDNALGLHLTLILYGVEYTINLFEPTCDRYRLWLINNLHSSPI